MKVAKFRSYALLAVALLWAITPTMACVLPGATPTPAERACCHHMAEHCGGAMMPASHSCCQSPTHRNSALKQGQAAPPLRQILRALVPAAVPSLPLPTFAPGVHFSLLHSPPPEPSPGDSSVLRI
jgi:hypothetical protein